MSTDDLRITGTEQLQTPASLIAKLPVSTQAADTVTRARDSVQRILDGQDDRLAVVVGPCSIHDVDAAKETQEGF